MARCWTIYYGDGLTYDERDGDAYAAPARDVQMVAVADPDHGWYLCRSNDYYWYLSETDVWQGGDVFGLWDYLIEPGPKKVLFGRTVSNAEFEKILMRAYADQSKTAWRPRERESAGVPS